MHSCKACKLHLQRTPVVPGAGRTYEPELLFVGSAPGSQEEIEGKPFVGGSARILHAACAQAGIKPKECFHTYIAKCRPPNNRELEIDEIFACQNTLAQEIANVKPKLVVALGEAPAQLLAGVSVRDYRGSIIPGHGCAKGFSVLIADDPHSLMRQRNLFPVLVQDLAKTKIDWPVIPETYLINPGRSAIIEFFSQWQGHEVAVDIETAADKEGGDKDALNPYRGDIIGIAFAPKPGIALNLGYSQMILNWDLIKPFLEQCPCIWANNLFDRTYLEVHQQIETNSLWDVQDAMHMIHSAQPKKLDFLRSLYTNMPPYKLRYKNQKGQYRPGELDDHSLGMLNCLDVDATIRIYHAQKGLVKPNVMRDLAEENQLALDMRLTGIRVNETVCAQHFLDTIPMINELQSKFEREYQVSITSPKQLNGLLYRDCGFPKHDDTGKPCRADKSPSTNEKAIQAIGQAIGLTYLDDEDGERFEGEHKHKEVLSDILISRGLNKLKSTYLEGAIKSVESDGRIHPQWGPTGTDTGRWSCRGYPVQGLTKHLRDIFIPAEGKIFMGADYKGAQILGAAILAKQWDLAESMLDPNFSIHEEVLQAIKPFYPSIKKIQAKTVVFGTFFGRSVKDIARAFHVTTADAQLWQDIFYGKYPKLKHLFEIKLPAEWEATGFITTIDGRKKYCERITEAKNTPVQNFESVVVKQAMRDLRRAGYTIVINNHDQLVCEEPDDSTVNERYEQMIYIMENARNDLFKRFPVDPGKGYSWKEV